MTALPALSVPAPKWGIRAPQLRVSGLAWLIAATLGIAFVAAITVVQFAGMRLHIEEFARFGVLAAGLFGIGAWCRLREMDSRLGAAAGIVGAATLSLLLCGVISNAGLRLGVPLADARLAAIDAALGIDVGAIIRWFAARAWLVQILSLAYNSSGLVVVALILGTLALGHVGRAWRLAATAIVAMQFVALLSLLAPAWGAMKQFGLEALQGSDLPAGAGVYQWPAFSHFYDGTDPVLRLADMGGVVAFPSFHTVLALLISQALAPTRLRWIGFAWTGAIVASAIPMGGHYVVDLAAGLAVWMVAAGIASRFSSPSA